MGFLGITDLRADVYKRQDTEGWQPSPPMEVIMNYRCETDLAAIKDYLQNAVVVAFDFETAPLLQYRDDSRAALDAHRACIVEMCIRDRP